MAGRPTQYQKLSLRATADVKNLKAGVAKMRHEIRTLKGSMSAAQKQSNTFGKSMANMARIGGALAAAFSVRAIGEFGTELLKLGEIVGGVSQAFEALNQPGLLNQLREATGNAVDDLQLMKSAVQARNFDIPLKGLAKLLRFASIRAAETGENIDHLVDSIILGLGRKSIMILDNLGISAIKLREETKKTGDFFKAFGKIVDEELAKSALTIEEAAKETDKLATSWKNLQIELSKSTSIMGSFLGRLGNFLNTFRATISEEGEVGRLLFDLQNVQQRLLQIVGGVAPAVRTTLLGGQLNMAEELSAELIKIVAQLNALGFTATGAAIPPPGTTPPPSTTTTTPGISRRADPIIPLKDWMDMRLMAPGIITSIESLDIITSTYQKTLERLREEMIELKAAAKETFEDTLLAGVTAMGDIMTPLFTEFAAAFTQGQNALQQFADFFKKWALQLAAQLLGLITLAAVLNALLPGAGGFAKVFKALGGGGFQDILNAFKAPSFSGVAGSGPILGPSFQTGTDFVPKTGLALLHRGEAVIPARANSFSGEIVLVARGYDLHAVIKTQDLMHKALGAT